MAKYKFKHDVDWYYPSNSAAHFSRKELRSLYSEYAKVARKRIKRLQDSEFYDTEPAAAEFTPLPKDATDSQVRKSLYEVVLYLNRSTSSVSGQKQKLKRFVETMHERGYDWVNMNNAKAFGEFMDQVKIHYGNRKGYYPEGTVEIYEEALERGADPEDLLEAFQYYLEDYQRIPDRKQIQKNEKQREREKKAWDKRIKERAEKTERRAGMPTRPTTRPKRNIRPLGSHRRRRR